MSREGTPTGYDLDHNRVRLGDGQSTFERAGQALLRWKHFPESWTQIQPTGLPIEEGKEVVLLIRVFGLWWVNACRIVYLLNEVQPVRRIGFAYGTLSDHVEKGEELFSVERDASGVVWYDIRAFSTPSHWLVRLCYPVARRLQKRFVRESQAAMRTIVRR